MKKAFISSLRLMAQFARGPISKDMRTEIERSYALRETINTQFDSIRSLADGVLFEFGSTRQQDLAFRDRIRRWQPQLRTLFTMGIAAWTYRLQLRGFELPEPERIFQQDFDARSARILEEMADRIEGQPIAEPVPSRKRALEVSLAAEPRTPDVRSFRTLLQGIESLTFALRDEIAKEFGRPGNVAVVEKLGADTGLEPA
jgi:multidrug resistance protein MdtO